MGQLGYNTRGPLVDKLKNLLNDVQGSYEAFLDAHTLYQEGKMDERTYFIRMGDFLRQFSSLGFLMVKVILELDASIGRGGRQQEQEARQMAAPLVRPSPSMEQFVQGVVQAPQPSKDVQKDTKTCIYCNAVIPARARFCPKCGKQQEDTRKEGGGGGEGVTGAASAGGEEKGSKKERRRKGS
ncbi:MAG: hypothetical protein NZ888_07370 [Candidatus Nitrosocaldus sp.]|nr:hypothetical protein [Candidatus Nitrosocaldus sp.]MDW8000667.1 hypothetical protein [Candidatus Nitrosocaldus sp.]